MKMQTILAVDDDENDQFICAYTIRRFNPDIRMLRAMNGLEALEVLKHTTPDAIILDINMPIMNGFEFLDRYRQDFETQAPVVAMLTSSHHAADRQRALGYEFVKSYFEKPLTMENLRTLELFLGEEKEGQS